MDKKTENRQTMDKNTENRQTMDKQTDNGQKDNGQRYCVNTYIMV